MPKQYRIANDHAGINLKKYIVDYMSSKGYQLFDFGVNQTASVDYPDFASKVCIALQKKEFQYGILICGSGIGMSISANKFKGIRATIARDYYDAHMAKAHNDANVLCLGERVTGNGTAQSIIDAWISSDFLGDRHTKRVDKIMGLEQ